MLTTDQKGNLAELAIAKEAARLGIGIYRAMTEGERYDLIFDIGERLIRVQCKWALLKGDVLVINACSNRRGPNGFIKRAYTAEQIDAFAAYAGELDRCFYLPIERFRNIRSILLRLGPSRNNQRRRINWADDFDFAATLRPLGAVAQLGERVHGMHEVTGSSPVGSIGSA